MRTPLLLAAVLLFTSTAMATVSVNAYLADGQTPLGLEDPNIPGVYKDIMVGTKLTLFVSSDTSEDWGGALWFPAKNWNAGVLFGRNSDENIYDFPDSCLEAAGFFPGVFCRIDDRGMLLSLIANENTMAGDWFVFDYQAEAAGTCYLGLYEAGPDPNSPSVPGYEWPFGYEQPPVQLFPLSTISLNHVPSRDYDGDGLVNFIDFAVLTSQWQTIAGTDPNTAPLSDLDNNYAVNIDDIALFCDYWLERTDVNLPMSDPNELGF